MFLNWKNYNHCILSKKKSKFSNILIFSKVSLRTDSYFQFLRIWSTYLPYDQQIRPSRKVI